MKSFEWGKAIQLCPISIIPLKMMYSSPVYNEIIFLDYLMRKPLEAHPAII